MSGDGGAVEMPIFEGARDASILPSFPSQAPVLPTEWRTIRGERAGGSRGPPPGVGHDSSAEISPAAPNPSVRNAGGRGDFAERWEGSRRNRTELGGAFHLADGRRSSRFFTFAHAPRPLPSSPSPRRKSLAPTPPRPLRRERRRDAQNPQCALKTRRTRRNANRQRGVGCIAAVLHPE